MANSLRRFLHGCKEPQTEAVEERKVARHAAGLLTFGSAAARQRLLLGGTCIGSEGEGLIKERSLMRGSACR
jgi:hypothetical protein